MAKRKMKRKTRRANKSINLVKAAESAVLANAVTMGLMGTSLPEFLTGRTRNRDFRFQPGGDGADVITLPELLGFRSGGFSLQGIGGNYGPGGSFLKSVGNNFDKNGAMMVSTLLLVPFAFKVGSKLTSRPRRTVNKVLDIAGLKSVVKV